MPEWFKVSNFSFINPTVAAGPDFGAITSLEIQHAMAVHPMVWMQTCEAKDMWWTSANGNTQHLGTMKPEHRYNLLKWMERHAVTLFKAASIHFYLPSQDPGEWLTKTPFYKGLQLMLAMDPPPAAYVQERQAINKQRWGQE